MGPEYKPCENCGKLIKNGKRKFCNAACKQAQWRKKKKSGVTV